MSTLTRGTEWNNTSAKITPGTSDKTVTLSTANKYVDKDIKLTIAGVSEDTAISKLGDAALGANASGISASVTSVTAGTKSSGKYPLTISESVTGIANATTTTSGYAKAGNTTGSGSISATVSPTYNMTAAAATVTASKQATAPTIAQGSAFTTDTTYKGTRISSTPQTSKIASGYYVSAKATAPATTLDITKTVNTAGYLGSNTEISASASTTANDKTYYFPVAAASIGNSESDPGTTYTENTSVTVPSNGWLTISAGYTPNIKISLDQLLDGKTDTAGTAAGHILSGYVAYNVDGEKLTGTIPTKTSDNVSSSASGKTVTTTIPAGYYASQITSSASVADATVAGTGTKQATAPTIAQGAAYTQDGTYKATRITATPSTTKPTSGYYIATQATAPATTGISVTQTAASAGYVDLAAGASIGTASTTSKSGSVYYSSIAESAITNNTTLGSNTSSGTITAGKYIKIGAGYYPNDRYYLAQSASSTSAAVLGASGTASASIGSSDVTIGTYNSTSKTVSITGSKDISGTASASTTTSGYATAGTTTGTGSVTGTASVSLSIAAYDGTYTVA